MCKILILAVALGELACAKPEPPPAAAAAPMRHHEIRADQLPAPFHTQSAGNPPNVVPRPTDARLTLPHGFRIEVWADGFADPRNMILAPNGDVFIADSAAGRIVVVREGKRWVFADELNRPFGLAFRGDQLYVGTSDAVVRFDYTPGQTLSSGAPTRVTPLPVGGHATRNLVFNRDASKMYVAVGSASNVDDETADPLRAAITEYNPDGSGKRPFASGLRNPIGLAWKGNALWTVVNERDGLGDDLVPDFATEVRDGAFYGWPFSYIGQRVDPRREGEHPELVARAIPPSLLLEAHSAPITIAFYDGTMFPERYRGGAFVALHGSWNRTARSGYKVVHVPFRGDEPAGGYDDFIIGWAPDPERDRVWGRPAGLLVLRDGSLLVSDDGAGVIWRVTHSR
ncbi:MAG TPA: PQQ-dependent sugar dehydrogenase [Thermoanaerobaculia bacterium]|jgi:glucose/arabinose dehydrogenase|nr:PQQ-dependent sugar dehydrogenase [Thermoanaerobaculia bacterium]